MTWEILVATIGIATGIAGVVFGFVSMQRNKKQDNTSEGKQMGVALTEIGYIKSGVDRMERKQEAQDEKYLTMAIHLESVDQSNKDAHKRMDGFEKRLHTVEEHHHYHE